VKTEPEDEAETEKEVTPEKPANKPPQGKENQYFINTHTGNRTSKLVAKKKADGSYETEAEIKDRLSDNWNVKDVECEYDEEGNCITSPGFKSKNAKRNRKSKARKKSKTQEALDAVPDKDEGIAKPDVEEITSGTVDSPMVETEAEGTQAPVETDEDLVIPSVDGERVYNLRDETKTLKLLFEEWTWTEGEAALVDKVVEEANEMKEGGLEKPVYDGEGVYTFIGTSAASEALTVAIVALKFLYLQGIGIDESLELMRLRHQEQYDRYNTKDDES
jgi:hypothetical protein